MVTNYDQCLEDALSFLIGLDESLFQQYKVLVLSFATIVIVLRVYVMFQGTQIQTEITIVNIGSDISDDQFSCFLDQGANDTNYMTFETFDELCEKPTPIPTTFPTDYPTDHPTIEYSDIDFFFRISHYFS